MARPSGLPPVGHAALTAVVSPILDRFDDSVERVELTTDPTPDHHVLLSLYAKPNHARTPDQYAAQMAPLAKAVIPVLLGRYPGLYAVDLCQEEQHPPADVYEPPPITRVYLARPRLGDITWSALDLAAIRAQAHGSDPAMQLYVDPSVAKSTTFQAAKPAT